MSGRSGQLERSQMSDENTLNDSKNFVIFDKRQMKKIQRDVDRSCSNDDSTIFTRSVNFKTFKPNNNLTINVKTNMNKNLVNNNLNKTMKNPDVNKKIEFITIKDKDKSHNKKYTEITNKPNYNLVMLNRSMEKLFKKDTDYNIKPHIIPTTEYNSYLKNLVFNQSALSTQNDEKCNKYYTFIFIIIIYYNTPIYIIKTKLVTT